MSEQERALARTVEAFGEAGSVLVASHRGPEGDALGSSLALALAFRDRGKQVRVLNVDPTPFNLRFLPGADLLVRELDDAERFDIACVVDCGDA